MTALQSTSLLRGKTGARPLCYPYQGASIHFPLAREDLSFFFFFLLCYASIHFPLAREDGLTVDQIANEIGSFNPLPSCEGRHTIHHLPHFLPFASIHFPLAREDEERLLKKVKVIVLQSTSLLRGKTYTDLLLSFTVDASIHFPLAREDITNSGTEQNAILLQSTSLLRGKTKRGGAEHGRYRASIHFPLAREDARTTAETTEEVASIHFPLAREDQTSLHFPCTVECFNPLPSCEGRPSFNGRLSSYLSFNPLPSCEGRLTSPHLFLCL